MTEDTNPPPSPAVPPSAPVPTASTSTPPAVDNADPGDESPEPVAIGKTGYDRILELLSKPPVNTPGLPPPKAGVPKDLRDWLAAFKEPLARMTVETAMSALQSRIGGYSRGRLKELYAQMTPAEMTAVMNANAAVIKTFSDQKALEAAMIASTTQKITEVSVNYLFKALTLLI